MQITVGTAHVDGEYEDMSDVKWKFTVRPALSDAVNEAAIVAGVEDVSKEMSRASALSPRGLKAWRSLALAQIVALTSVTAKDGTPVTVRNGAEVKPATDPSVRDVLLRANDTLAVLVGMKASNAGWVVEEARGNLLPASV